MNNNAQGIGAGANSKIQNFLEALRASQSGGYTAKPNESSEHNPFAEFSAKKEVEKRRSEQFFQARQQEWNGVFSAKEKQREQKIESLRSQLKDLSKQVVRLDKNLAQAVSSPIVAAGTYHETYFQHIQSMITLFSMKVNKANSWLELFNNRSAKQGAYWGKAKTLGTSFTQNNERAIATSVG